MSYKTLFILMVLVVGGGVSLGNYLAPEPDEEVHRIGDIVRVLKNSYSYTVYTQQPGMQRLEETTLYNRCLISQSTGALLTDAQEGEPIWAEYRLERGEACLVNLHLHRPQDINGGTWDAGKFGNGNIQVIE